MAMDSVLDFTCRDQRSCLMEPRLYAIAGPSCSPQGMWAKMIEGFFFESWNARQCSAPARSERKAPISGARTTTPLEPGSAGLEVFLYYPNCSQKTLQGKLVRPSVQPARKFECRPCDHPARAARGPLSVRRSRRERRRLRACAPKKYPHQLPVCGVSHPAIAFGSLFSPPQPPRRRSFFHNAQLVLCSKSTLLQRVLPRVL